NARSLMFALADLGLAVDVVSDAMDRRLPPRRQGSIPEMDVPLDSGAKRVLDLAAEDARARQDFHVGTEHLLVGIVRESDGLGGPLLLELGISLGVVDRVIQRLRAARVR